MNGNLFCILPLQAENDKNGKQTMTQEGQILKAMKLENSCESIQVKMRQFGQFLNEYF